MTKRYFYTCPLKAAHMVKYHGVPDGGINDIKEIPIGETVQMGDGTKYQCIKCKFPECI